MLRLQHIRKQYQTGTFIQNALDDVSLSLRDSEFVAILGPSGSGKTTLLNVIGGLDRYDSGELEIDGISTVRYKDRDWDSYRNHAVGFVFQSYNLIPHQSILANVELALTISGITGAERKQRAAEALAKVGLGEQLQKKPSQLSGGQMQRVAIARALVNNPKILLADEPTGALDSETSVQVMELLKQVAQDRLVVMVTHNPELAEEYATRIVTLKDGKILADTDPFDPDAELDAIPAMAAAGLAGTGTAGAAAGLAGAETAGAATGLVRAEATDAEPGADGIEAEPGEATAEPKRRREVRHESMGKAGMSFFTALYLSFNNLLTKKGRTFLVSFAGSIGIIGIALILSLSNGVRAYIADIEEETLSQYPISIEKTSLDMAGMMGIDLSDPDAGGGSTAEEGQQTFLPGKQDTEEENPKVAEFPTVTGMFSKMNTNDLGSFKKYIDKNRKTLDQWATSVEYKYDIVPQIYTAYGTNADGSTHYRIVNPESTFNGTDLGNTMSAGSMFGFGNANSFIALPQDPDLYRDQYKVRAGRWPKKSNEIVLVLTGSGRVSDMALYIMGMKDYSKLEEAVKQYGSEGTVNYKSETVSYDAKDFLDKEFKLVNAADFYSYDGTYGVWTSKADDAAFTDALAAKGKTLKIVGVVQPKKADSISILTTGFGYLPSLKRELSDYAGTTPVVKAQLLDARTDVLTGQPFGAENNGPDFSKLFTVDQAAMAKAFQFNMGNANAKPDPEMLAKALAGSGATGQILQDMMQSVTQEQMQELFNSLVEGYDAYAKANNKAQTSQISAGVQQYLQSAEAQAIIRKHLESIVGDAMEGAITQDTLRKLTEKVMSGFPDYCEKNGLTDPSKMGEYLQQYLQSPEAAALMDEVLAELAGEIQVPDITEAQMAALTKDLMDGYSKYAAEHNLVTIEMLSKDFREYLGTKDAEQRINTALVKMFGKGTPGAAAMDKMSAALSQAMQAYLGQMFSGAGMKVDTAALQQAMGFNLTAADMKSLMTSLLSTGTHTQESNLRTLGYQAEEDLTSITIYPKNFKDKDKIVAFIDEYNEKQRSADHKERVISFTDLVGTMMTSVNKIIDTISYMLVAFVSISLVVSSIMIGVITYISVLERRKEIGILRALGASKHNISNVFNAETFIIGAFAGILGVVISLLLLIPGNYIIHAVTGNMRLRVFLPVLPAVILVMLSIFLTLLGGFIPARKAAKSDPVAALRNE